MKRRDSFGEMMAGIATMKTHREGQAKLETYEVEASHATREKFRTPGKTNAACIREGRDGE